jgi:hypothetical protein
MLKDYYLGIEEARQVVQDHYDSLYEHYDDIQISNKNTGEVMKTYHSGGE